MSGYLGLPILVLIAILQSTVVSNIHAFGGTPNLMLLVVVCWSLVARGAQGLVWAFWGGVLLDLFSGGPLGASAAGLLLVVYLAGFTEGRLWGSRLLLPLAAVLFGSLMYHLVVLGFLVVFGRVVDLVSTVRTITFPSTFINLVLTLPVYNLTRWFHNFLNPPAVEI